MHQNLSAYIFLCSSFKERHICKLSEKWTAWKYIMYVLQSRKQIMYFLQIFFFQIYVPLKTIY